MIRLWRCIAGLLFAATVSGAPALAQESPFGAGWELQAEASSLQFQSIKNQSKIETSSFATLSGAIGPDGLATLKILLDSVDTKVDLRNVRMRFLFFETFQYPEANVTARIDPALVADLSESPRTNVTLPFTLDLHGVTRDLEAELALTLIGGDLVAVSTAEPVAIDVADFNLTEGLTKLEEAANVSIVPSTTVSFDLIFRKLPDDAQPAQQVAARAPDGVENPAAAALEEDGDFSLEACVGRFEILSRTDVRFTPGSARLQPDSFPLLDAVADIVTRCPGMDIVIAGHTDSIGARSYNQRLSEARAASVVDYLAGKGVGAGRMTAMGLGEDRPVADNATNRGRLRNRRIEFSVADG